MSKETRITIGTDPEFFLKKAGTYVSSQSANVKGTKHEPVALPSGGTVQRDNVAVEFATDPAEDGDDFVGKVKSCLSDIHNIIPEDCELVVEPSATFDEDQLTDPEAQEFGCEPDFNAYTVAVNEKPWCGDSCFRSAGAHIHVGGLLDDGTPMPGYEFLQEFEGKINGVKAMDLMHGTISTKLDNSEASIRRRELYGKAGCHRATPYGFEYRVLSNYWMKSPQLVMLMDSLTQDAMALVASGKLAEILNLVGEDELQNAINTGNVAAADKIISNYVLPNISSTTRDLYEMCAENLPKYKSVKEEWGI